jgi:hypothetical protein
VSPSPEKARYPCTLGGAVATGRRRLALLLTVLAVSMIVAAITCWATGRLIPGLIALGVAGVVGLAWRMSNDLRPRNLTLEPALMHIETVRQLIPVSIEGAQIRPLEPQEIKHIENLASVGGFVAGSGGFDSRLLGEFDLYASDLAHGLWVQGPAGRFVVTPDDPTKFLREFEQMATSPLLQSSSHE